MVFPVFFISSKEAFVPACDAYQRARARRAPPAPAPTCFGINCRSDDALGRAVKVRASAPRTNGPAADMRTSPTVTRERERKGSTVGAEGRAGTTASE
ncbi:hypothetical protein EVAR_38631_1 [Eumeta japonica]|uniref:Uncharacterized protein n=1 Tax=Eumeta variegata TaxID=151549 RepID=A0A4C1Y1X0_EUMVA|nr:hypothetical protein EVAR_38631_1 [Eumeta japonica]